MTLLGVIPAVYSTIDGRPFEVGGPPGDEKEPPDSGLLTRKHDLSVVVDVVPALPGRPTTFGSRSLRD
jgi:hypothetical protein